MKEGDFRRSLAEQFRRLGWQATIIENAASNGLPDLHIFADSKDVWMELKTCDTQETKATLRASQFNWAHKRYLSGGNSYVVILNLKNDTVSLFDSGDFIKSGTLTVSGQPVFACRRKDFLTTFLKKYCMEVKRFIAL